ncbi:MAG: SdrD B-like domain-containing protein [Candidatus Krumholzibacteriia bacterium]
MHNTSKNSAGFTLVEMMVSVLVLGVLMIAMGGLFVLFQKSSAQTNEYTEVQQNVRIALDFVTNHLRQAGSQTDYFRGQQPVVHAGPYQVAINADIDNQQTIDGLSPLSAIRRAFSPNRVPASGTVIYAPTTDYQSNAETIVLTLDSNGDGVVSASDRGDDPEENGRNSNLFILKSVVYGYDGAGANEVRESNLALLRGPNMAPTWTIPQPLFQYFYDHDNNPSTADRLWGDGNLNGVLETGEITALTVMPQNLLSSIRKIKTTAVGESNVYNMKFETNGGYLGVTMTSEVYVRNAARTSSNIYGKVYHDIDSDGIPDQDETGIPRVEIRLTGQSRSVLTDNFGMFYFPLPAGTYSLTEVDPPGYTSTTANMVSVTLAAGQTSIINFGDRSTTPTGKIKGIVYEDADADGIKDAGETGLNGVLVSLDNGAQALTGSTGYYSFIVQRGTYTVVETDPTGYSSTTANSVVATVAAGTDTVTVNYGDYGAPVSGTLQGYVYIDENEDGFRGGTEEGVPNVVLRASNGDSATTNSKGLYKFTLAPGTYSVTETDPDGYTSTTVNTFNGIVIAVDTLVTRNFGDILEIRQDFVEIHISHTDRALSVAATDLSEDTKGDIDIVLGTALAAATGNMLVFHNDWQSASTPIGELFEADPTYRRDAMQNINTISKYDFTGDGTPDVLDGLDYSIGRNVQVWFTGSGGVLSTSPDAAYITNGSTVVMDSKLADFNNDGNIDLVVALKSSFGTYTGGFEAFNGSGGGMFSSSHYITTAGTTGSINLGEIWAVDTGDIDGDGDQDIIVGSHTNAYAGFIDIYRNNGVGTGNFTWHSRYVTNGAVNDLKVVDMREDDGDDPDILAATSTGANIGNIVLWLNTAGTFGLPDTTGYIFAPQETHNWPDDYVDALGEALSLATLHVNNDLFTDVAYGTRSSALYTGDIYILSCYGTLPTYGQKINKTEAGEIITMDVADFNKDNRPDIVVGTRTSATQGRLIAYFGKEL